MTTKRRPKKAGKDRRTHDIARLRWAARWLHRDDPDWFEGGCGDIAVLLEEFARRVGMPGVRAVGGQAGASGDVCFHAWLDLGGRRYDPRADVEGHRYAGYAPNDKALGILVAEWPEEDEEEWGAASRIARLMVAHEERVGLADAPASTSALARSMERLSEGDEDPAEGRKKNPPTGPLFRSGSRTIDRYFDSMAKKGLSRRDVASGLIPCARMVWESDARRRLEGIDFDRAGEEDLGADVASAALDAVERWSEGGGVSEADAGHYRSVLGRMQRALEIRLFEAQRLLPREMLATDDYFDRLGRMAEEDPAARAVLGVTPALHLVNVVYSLANVAWRAYPGDRGMGAVERSVAASSGHFARAVSWVFVALGESAPAATSRALECVRASFAGPPVIRRAARPRRAIV